jgi:hypothetical protein
MILTSIEMIAVASWAPSWSWKEAVIEQVRGLCLVVSYGCLSVRASHFGIRSARSVA